MGIWKIDNVSSQEWDRRMMRRHEIKQWTITILQIMGMVGSVLLLIWLMKWLGVI